MRAFSQILQAWMKGSGLHASLHAVPEVSLHGVLAYSGKASRPLVTLEWAAWYTDTQLDGSLTILHVPLCALAS